MSIKQRLEKLYYLRFVIWAVIAIGITFIINGLYMMRTHGLFVVSLFQLIVGTLLIWAAIRAYKELCREVKLIRRITK